MVTKVLIPDVKSGTQNHNRTEFNLPQAPLQMQVYGH